MWWKPNIQVSTSEIKFYGKQKFARILNLEFKVNGSSDCKSFHPCSENLTNYPPQVLKK